MVKDEQATDGTVRHQAGPIGEEHPALRELARRRRRALSRPPRAPSRVRLFHCNDLHHVVGDASGGMVGIAYWLRARQTQIPGSHELPEARLFVGAGDDMTGSVLDELLPDVGIGGDVSGEHPGYGLFNILGLDMGAVGNHDLDRGLQVFAEAARTARFPLLAANLHLPPAWSEWVCPAAILCTSGGVRIGVIGVMTGGQLPPAVRGQAVVSDPLSAVAELAEFLQGLTDVRIVLSHLGYWAGSTDAVVEPMGDRELATAIGSQALRSRPEPQIHLIVGGHTHDALNKEELESHNVVAGIPIVQAGAFGAWLGEVEILVTPTSDGVHAVVSSARLWPTDLAQVGEPEPVAYTSASHFFAQHVAPQLARAHARLAQPLATASLAPGIICSEWAKGFDAGEVDTANFFADCLVDAVRGAAHLIDFAMVDVSLACRGFLGGVLTRRELFEIMLHADVIEIVEMPRSLLGDFLADNLMRAARPVEAGFAHCSRELRYVGQWSDGAEPVPHLVSAKLSGVSVWPSGVEPFSDDSVPVRVAVPSFLRVRARQWERSRTKPVFRLGDFPHINTGLLVRAAISQVIEGLGRIDATTGLATDGRMWLKDHCAPVEES